MPESSPQRTASASAATASPLPSPPTAVFIASFKKAVKKTYYSNKAITSCVADFEFYDNYDNDEDEVFIGRDLAHTRGYGEHVASAIDEEIKRIIDECYLKAKELITERRDVLDACAELLIRKEKITRDEFEALFQS